MGATAVVESGNNTAYQKKLADLLDSRDPLEVLGHTPAVIAKFARDESDAVLSKRPFEESGRRRKSSGICSMRSGCTLIASG